MKVLKTNYVVVFQRKTNHRGELGNWIYKMILEMVLWKLLIKKPRQQRNNNQANQTKPAQILLFNLRTDLSETNNLADTHPDIVERLTARMTALDAEITQNARSPWFKE